MGAGGGLRGVLFQIYDGNNRAMIIDEAFRYPEAKDVVDFHIYGAFVLAEVLMLLEDLCPQINEELNMSTEDLPPSMLMGHYAQFWNHLELLANH